MILLVDDEIPLLRLLATVLQREGYHVLAASGAPEALRILESHHGIIHLMVTDVNMLAMSGTDLAERMRDQMPGLPVLFISGSFPKTIRFARVRWEPLNAFLQKPFSANSLLRAVENLLDTTSAEGAHASRTEPHNERDVV